MKVASATTVSAKQCVNSPGLPEPLGWPAFPIPSSHLRTSDDVRCPAEGAGAGRRGGSRDAVGGREHGGVWTRAGFHPVPLGAESLSCPSANSPETRASLEASVPVSHPHLVSGSTNTPCAQPWAGLCRAGDTVVAKAPPSPVLPSRTHSPVLAVRTQGVRAGMGVPGHTWPSLKARRAAWRRGSGRQERRP